MMAGTGPHPRDQRSLDAVLSRWRDRTVSHRGYLPGGWDDDATNQLVAAVVGGFDLTAASGAFATTRYRSGWTHDEVLADLEDLCAVTPLVSSGQACTVMRQTASVWIHQLTIETVAGPHRDPLTGLPSLGFLVMAAERLYRRSEVPDQTHSLVVAQLATSEVGPHRVAALLDLSRQADQGLASEGIVAALGTVGIAAIVETSAANDERSLALASPPGTVDRGVRVVVEPLPASVHLLEARLAHHATTRLAPSA